MPLFSIIVPVFRAEAYLPQCIDSLIDQSFSDFEILLVEDGSPDRSGEICDAYATRDSRIRVIHKENGGVTSARQAGAEAAAGEYIACVDADDWVSPEYLVRFAEVIRQHRVDVAICGHYTAYPHKQYPCPCQFPHGVYTRKQLETDIFPQLLFGAEKRQLVPALWGKVFRASMFKKQHSSLPFAVTTGEDWAVSRACIYHAKSACILPDCLYYYRQNPESVMRKTKVFAMDTPRLIATYWARQMDLSKYDLQGQLCRYLVYCLFHDVSSQFYRKAPIGEIIKSIKAQIEEPCYRSCIENCRFCGDVKGTLAKFALKHRLYGIFWLYCRLK